jgi:subtilisin family serine protease
MVVNMSLGGLRSRQLNAAVARLVEAGVVLVAAAGNRGISACIGSPGSSKAAITVGASTFSSWLGRDRRARFSNHGRCVDIFA